MSLLSLWKQHASLVLLQVSNDSKQKGSVFFEEVFGVNGNELLFLCLLEVEGEISPTSFNRYPFAGSIKLIYEETINKLYWLGWLEPPVMRQDQLVYHPGWLYLQRKEYWRITKNEDEDRTPSLYWPSNMEMIFPMTKEVYERTLEKLSDDMQQEQFECFQGEMFMEEFSDAEKEYYRKQDEKQRTLIRKLQERYNEWKEYVPKYYH